MIYTVTLNPSLDYVMHLDRLNIEGVNRSQKEEIYPGGKGINVSVVLNNLGIPNKALGFIAGFTGDEIDRILKDLGSTTHFIKLEQGMSRVNVKLEADNEVEINGMGPEITSNNLTQLLDSLEEIQDGDFLVLAGSIPKSVPDSIYEDIMKALSHKNIEIIVDATKDLLLNVLQYKPFLIKPNHLELAELFHVTLETEEDIITYAKKLQTMGARNVLISMGGNGSILIAENGQVLKETVPSGKVLNTVGSGDSMVAGFIAGCLRYKDLKDILKFAAATGSATAFSSWLATKDKIESLFAQL